MPNKFKAPDKIYLQITDDEGEHSDEITWCVDKINDDDVEYIRVNKQRVTKTLRKAADAASTVLHSKSSSKAVKTAAGSAFTQSLRIKL